MKAASETGSDRAYTSGNLEKYRSANPVKRLLVSRMQDSVISLAVRCCGSGTSVRILDAGCGEGLVASALEKQLPDAEFVLCDTSRAALDYAKTVCSERCAFQCGSVTALPFPDGAFDLVLCSEVLEHLEQPEKGLSELLRVSSGCVLVSVPHEPWFRMGNLLSLKNMSRLGDPPGHLNHWTLRAFRRWILARTAGWEASFSHSFP